MAFDPRRGHVVLFGGRSGGALLDDTWEWDHRTKEWREVPTVIAPSVRYGGAMAQDATGALVVVGGVTTGSPSLSEIVRLRYERGLEPAERCVLATEDLDRDGLMGCADPDCWTRCAPSCLPGTTCDPAQPHCGDSHCDQTVEDYLICPADCPAP